MTTKTTFPKTLPGLLVFIVFNLLLLSACKQLEANTETGANEKHLPVVETDTPVVAKKAIPVIDKALYDSLQMHLVANKPTAAWPVKTDYPAPGAVFPFKRIVAFYGNFYSKGMGILGELPPDEMLQKLQQEVARWQAADTAIPVQPAIHYIAVTAQRNPGKGNKYRLRMPFTQIDHAIELANKINALVFLDVQTGHSSLREELPELEPYLKMPNVHLGIDPEFAMPAGRVPSSVIGSFDAADVNYATSFLDSMVSRYGVPPKVLVVHRFTKGMLTNSKNIKMSPNVQVVIDMDGWGFPAKKKSSYELAITREPVQYAGFKLFYKNDTKGSYRLMEPADVLGLYPSPVYIQYQ